tara:strand:- start:1040 stop:1912 length:873 start_codon:yes stop_codon:yes gene_type:complete
MFSITIPTLNNLKYLKLCLESLQKNSTYNHEIIVHVNIGSDGTLDFLKEKKIKYSFTNYNSGICEGVNKASKLATNEFLLYAHDDFYFCPKWDEILFSELKKIPSKKFYLSGTMLELSNTKNNFGDTIDNFHEKKLLDNFQNIKLEDFQGSTWAPHLIPKDLWNKVGGFSEEYYPGTGSDPDLNMKLWNEGVRIFKGVGASKVYHFGSIVTRKSKNKDIKTESGSKGGKIFLLKWKFSIKFFKKHYLRSGSKYDGPLTNPKKSFSYYKDFLISKLTYLYISITNLIFKYR